jgi:lambda family phage tail tape measure protein
MSSLKDNVGVLLQPVGASFQDTFTGIVKNIDGAAKALRDFLKIGDKFIKEQIEAEEKLLAGLQKQRDLISSQYPGLEERLPERFASIIADADSKIADQINKINELRLKLADINGELTEGKKNTEDLGNTGKTAFENLKAGATSYMDSIKNISQQIQDATKNAFTKMEDALVNFVQTGKLNFADFARSIIADITKIYIRSQILKMFQGLGSLFGPTNTAVEGAVTTPNWGGGRTRITSGSMPVGVNALGNVYGKNGIVPFAYGGVVDKPTLFPFSKGTGLMGEAGPEAIMPLKRTQDGRLGVEAAMGRYSGSGSTTVNYTGPVMNFNGDDYVPRSAVNDIINAAASQGAKAGENRTLSTLKNSRSARSRLGM